MKAYKKYKDSGINWIGQIPEHWNVNAIRSLFREVKEKTKDDSGVLLSLSQYTGVRPKAECENNVGMFEAETTVGYNIVHKGQFVMNIMLAWNGSYSVSNYDGIISPAYCVFDFILDVSKKYYDYLLRMKCYAGAFKTMSKGIIESRLRLYPQYFKTFPIVVPPKDEQDAIVAYIDKKVADIDRFVAAKERQLSLLDELKQKIIADAVTGKCPEAMGRKRAPEYKETNIPWIPQIPAHWEVNSIRYLLKEAKETTDNGKGTLLSLSQYTGVKPKSECEKIGMFEAESTIGYNVVHIGQFVMNIMLAWNGSYAVSNYEGIISPSYCIFDFIVDVNKMYYNYLLRMKSYAGAFKTLSKGIIDSRLRLYPQYFRSFPIIIPPKEEQDSIVAYIDKKVSQIAKLRSGIESQIKHLKEYKQTIISDAVTGKVCVTGV